MIADMDFLPYVAGRLVELGATAIVVGLLNVYLLRDRLAAVRRDLETVSEDLDKGRQAQGEAVEGLDERINAEAVHRLMCRNESMEMFCSQAQLEGATRAQTAEIHAVRTAIDAVHGRVTEVARAVSRIEGELAASNPNRSVQT